MGPFEGVVKGERGQHLPTYEQENFFTDCSILSMTKQRQPSHDALKTKLKNHLSYKINEVEPCSIMGNYHFAAAVICFCFFLCRSSSVIRYECENRRKR